MVLAPLIRGQKGEYKDLFADLLKQGFARARVDGQVVPLTDNLRLDRQMRHNIEVVIDRLTIKSDVRPRLAEAVELAMKMGEGSLIVTPEDDSKEAKESTSRSVRNTPTKSKRKMTKTTRRTNLETRHRRR